MGNKQLVQRFYDNIVNAKENEAIDSLIHPKYINHGFPISANGPEAMRQITGMMFGAFPDLHAIVEEYVCEGNSIATRGYWNATHKGEFMGNPPTGKNVRVPYIEIWNIKDGKLCENWFQMDFVGLLEQIKS